MPYEWITAYVSVMFWHVNRQLIYDIVKVKIHECERESFMV